MTRLASKHTNKPENAYFLAVEQGISWIKKQQRPLWIGFAAIFTLALGFLAMQQRTKLQTAQASKLFNQAMTQLAAIQIADDPNRANPNTVSTPAKLQAVLPQLAEVTQLMGYQQTGLLAAMMTAVVQEQAEQAQEAEASWRLVQKNITEDHTWQLLVAERLAYLREAQGDTEGALAALNNHASSTFYKDYVQMSQARLYAAKHDTTQASQILEQIIQEKPDTPLRDLVQSRLASIKNSASPTNTAAAVPQP